MAGKGLHLSQSVIAPRGTSVAFHRQATVEDNTTTRQQNSLNTDANTEAISVGDTQLPSLAGRHKEGGDAATCLHGVGRSRSLAHTVRRMLPCLWHEADHTSHAWDKAESCVKNCERIQREFTDRLNLADVSLVGVFVQLNRVLFLNAYYQVFSCLKGRNVPDRPERESAR